MTDANPPTTLLLLLCDFKAYAMDGAAAANEYSHFFVLPLSKTPVSEFIVITTRW